MHIHVYFFLTRILYVFTCFRYSWSDSISTSHCNICFTNGTNTPLPRLSLSLRSFRHSMAVWRIPAYGLVMVNSRFIMTTKDHHVHTYANYLIVTVSNEKLVKTICYFLLFLTHLNLWTWTLNPAWAVYRQVRPEFVGWPSPLTSHWDHYNAVSTEFRETSVWHHYSSDASKNNIYLKNHQWCIQQHITNT